MITQTPHPIGPMPRSAFVGDNGSTFLLLAIGLLAIAANQLRKRRRRDTSRE